jgi:hypothetical protein
MTQAEKKKSTTQTSTSHSTGPHRKHKARNYAAHTGTRAGANMWLGTTEVDNKENGNIDVKLRDLRKITWRQKKEEWND